MTSKAIVTLFAAAVVGATLLADPHGDAEAKKVRPGAELKLKVSPEVDTEADAAFGEPTKEQKADYESLEKALTELEIAAGRSPRETDSTLK